MDNSKETPNTPNQPVVNQPMSGQGPVMQQPFQPKKKTGLIVGLIIAGVLLVGGIITAVLLLVPKNVDYTELQDAMSDLSEAHAVMMTDSVVASQQNINRLGGGEVDTEAVDEAHTGIVEAADTIAKKEAKVSELVAKSGDEKLKERYSRYQEKSKKAWGDYTPKSYATRQVYGDKIQLSSCADSSIELELSASTMTDAQKFVKTSKTCETFFDDLAKKQDLGEYKDYVTWGATFFKKAGAEYADMLEDKARDETFIATATKQFQEQTQAYNKIYQDNGSMLLDVSMSTVEFMTFITNKANR